MERSLFGFILKYSKREQLLIVPLVVLSMVFYYLSLDLPKMIINQPIQGQGFASPGATADFLRVHVALPEFLGGYAFTLFDGFALERTDYLIALKAAGFTRVSFGMQSAVPHVLATLERTHDPQRVPLVVRWGRNCRWKMAWCGRRLPIFWRATSSQNVCATG